MTTETWGAGISTGFGYRSSTMRRQDFGAGGAHAVDVVGGQFGMKRQRHGRVGNAFGVGKAAAMIAEAAIDRGQVRGLVRHARADASLLQRIAELAPRYLELRQRQ